MTPDSIPFKNKYLIRIYPNVYAGEIYSYPDVVLQEELSFQERNDALLNKLFELSSENLEALSKLVGWTYEIICLTFIDLDVKLSENRIYLTKETSNFNIDYLLKNPHTSFPSADLSSSLEPLYINLTDNPTDIYLANSVSMKNFITKARFVAIGDLEKFLSESTLNDALLKLRKSEEARLFEEANFIKNQQESLIEDNEKGMLKMLIPKHLEFSKKLVKQKNK